MKGHTPWQRHHGSAARWLAGATILCLAGFVSTAVLARSSAEDKGPEPNRAVAFEVVGKTQCVLARKCSIAPVPLHPVTEVLVQPGSRVKKGQVLVKLDDDEQQAEVRTKQAALESAELALKEARRHSEAVNKAIGSIPEKLYCDVCLRALTAEREERMAKAALESAKAELEHFEVTSQIDGVVSWLNVHLGMVSRPGTTVWGEILDLREIEVRCALSLDQVERIAVGQPAEIRRKARDQACGTARVVFIGIEADPKTELVPVHLLLANPNETLRSGETVRVRFGGDVASGAAK
jgi:membrane fusion protein (multidrug efflux system)